MCLSPIHLKNPYRGTGRIGINAFHDTTSAYIKVPCGSCPQCASMRQGFFLQRVQMESLRSHIFYFTLTYNDESLMTTDVGEYNLPFAYLPDIQNMCKRLRNDGYKFRMCYVTEYGKDRHRPHYHGLLAVEKSDEHWSIVEHRYKRLFMKEWRRNYNLTKGRNPDYRPLFTPVYDCTGKCLTFDFHYVEPIMNHDNDVSFYVSKYITKYDKWIKSLLAKISLDPNLSGEEIIYLKSLLKPRCVMSKDFGDWRDPVIFAKISKMGNAPSKFRYPQYYDIYTGKQMPMSPYYGKHIVGFEHCYERLLNSDNPDSMSTIYDNDNTVLDSQQITDSSIRQMQDYERKLKKLENRLKY